MECFLEKAMHKRVTVSLFAMIVIFYLFYALQTGEDNCYSTFSLNDVGRYLSDIMEFERKPTLGKSIFFHETSCSHTGLTHLSARQGCAVESAALNNPNADVFLIFSGPKLLKNGLNVKILEALSNYSNIHIRSLNLQTYALDTPAYEWLNARNIFSSKYLKSHLSDFLRYLTLYKWGGTYLDLDVIVKRNFDAMGSNYAGAESSSYVASGVINLDYRGVGHRVASALLKNFILNFNGKNWGGNGPGVITRVLQKLCRTSNPSMMNRERCNGFLVYPTNSFYAVPWQQWENFFSPRYLDDVLNETENSILVHVWNRHSEKYITRPGVDVAYTVLAKKYCPQIYNSASNHLD